MDDAGLERNGFLREGSASRTRPTTCFASRGVGTLYASEGAKMQGPKTRLDQVSFSVVVLDSWSSIPIYAANLLLQKLNKRHSHRFSVKQELLYIVSNT